MKASNSILTQGPASGEDIERYEIVDGVRMEREPMGAFETVLASWLCHVINSFAAGKKLGLAVNEVLFVLNAARTLSVVLTWPSCPMPVGPQPLWHVNLPGMSCPTWLSKLSVPRILRRRLTARLRTTFRQGFAWSGCFIRILAGSTSISRRRTSAFWNAPTPWMAARYCPAFGYPLPNCMKPWPNQNKPSAVPRSRRRGLP